jgi:hypothetical protein
MMRIFNTSILLLQYYKPNRIKTAENFIIIFEAPCARTAGGDSGPSPAPAPPPCLTASTYIYVWLRERGGPGVFHPTHA